MDPLPEVRAGLDRLSSALEEGTSLAGYLDGVAKVAEAIIPSCVGVSITIIPDGDPFTITATTPDATALDAVQNLDGGPCLEALETEELLGVDDLLDEGGSSCFGAAAASAEVRSSLSFPIRDIDGLISGGMNLYASDPHAFQGRERLRAREDIDRGVGALAELQGLGAPVNVVGFRPGFGADHAS